ncbi:MAG: hypothetical protein JO029_10750 [Candidatus Eremiobacteraeota bacterium]|nr:hypothetical protein [Candidatus Eremiobacteraeota bacterium]
MKRFLCTVVLVCFAGCNGQTAAAPFGPERAQAARHARVDGSKGKIDHVVIVVQENRSFDNYFYGFKGADYARSGKMSNGSTVQLHGIPLGGPVVVNSWHDGLYDWDNGRMDRFDQNLLGGAAPAGAYVYSYVYRRDIEPYWIMARSYVLADHMFPTMFGGSFTGHLELIASTTDVAPGVADSDTPSNTPWGCDAPPKTVTSIVDASRDESWGGGPFPCFTQFQTLADTLDAKRVSWKYYAPAVSSGNLGGQLWTEFDAIENVRKGPDWTRNVVSPPSRVLSDAKSGKLPSVSWVIPDGVDSDHPGGPSLGPSWVAAIVNAIGTGPAWNSTAIVVLWDDWGGWYDHVPPPQLDFRGLGIRVPCIIVSPYAKAHTISHTQYEFGSVVRLIEEVFGLPALGPSGTGYTDRRANSMLDAFDLHQAPLPFKPIPAKEPASFFLMQKPSGAPPDDD